MGGLALILEFQGSSSSSSLSAKHITLLHSAGSLCALSAATSAASFYGFLPRPIFDPLSRHLTAPTAYCEEFHDRETDIEDWKARRYEAGFSYSKSLFEKEYRVTLRPMFSAFSPGALTLTFTRALLLNFQPIVEAYILRFKPEDEDDFEEEQPAAHEPIDYDAALKGTGWTAFREVTVVTTRRLLERIVLHNVSKRTTWKLLKDLQRSAERKALRFDSKFELFFGVTKTTFRGHAVAIAASWLVQLIFDIYKCVWNVYRRKRKLEKGNTKGYYEVEVDELIKLWRKVVGNTLKCGASLALASVGAGAGATIVRPALGQWIGCMVGETAGAIGMGILIDPWVIFGSFNSLEVD